MAALVRGYLAGTQTWVSSRTGKTLLGDAGCGLSFAEAYEALRDAPRAWLEEFRGDLRAQRGWEFLHGSRDWSVVEAGEVRALFYNPAPATIQTSACARGGPPPLFGPLGSAVGGLALAAPLFDVGAGVEDRSRRRRGGGDDDPRGGALNV